MDALMDIPLLNMPGPQFLLVYPVFAAIVLAGLNMALRLGSSDATPPSLPTRPDPYEIAYLRDGVAGMLSLAIYSLKRANVVELDANGRLTRLAGQARPTHPVEAAVYAEVGDGATLKDLLSSRDLRASVGRQADVLADRLSRQGLLKTEAERWSAYGMATLAALALAALWGAKVIVTQAHGHHNVGLLFMEFAVAIVLVIVSVRAVNKGVANGRGAAYLKQFRTAYSGRARELISGDARYEPLAAGVALAVVGALGYEALYGTQDEALAQEFKRQVASSSSSDGGSSCSSGDGGGSGCGGCGGGGD